jgi:hypothetical protein
MTCSLFVAWQDEVKVLGFVNRIKNWEDRAAGVAN